jgi:acid phosphatase (class A)
MTLQRKPLIVLAALFCLLQVSADRAAFITPEQFDFKSIMGDPPADGSPEHKQEVDRMLDLQAARTPDEERRCKSEEEVTVFGFSTVLGDDFNEKNLPVTAKVMADAYSDAKNVSGAAKLTWRRVRPPLAEPRIRPCVALEHTASYPSGHAIRGIVWATLLAEIYPDKRDALMDRGKQIGDDRFLAGMHYPTDVAAGQKLGAAIAKALLANVEFKAELETAKAECLAKAAAAKH